MLLLGGPNLGDLELPSEPKQTWYSSPSGRNSIS